MTEPTTATCKRGHERTADNTQIHRHTKNDKTRVQLTCKDCAKEDRQRRKAQQNEAVT